MVRAPTASAMRPKYKKSLFVGTVNQGPRDASISPLDIRVSVKFSSSVVFFFRAVPSRWKEASLASAVYKSLKTLRFAGFMSDTPTPSHGKEAAKNPRGTWTGAFSSKTVLLSSRRNDTGVVTISSPNSKEHPSGR